MRMSNPSSNDDGTNNSSNNQLYNNGYRRMCEYPSLLPFNHMEIFEPAFNRYLAQNKAIYDARYPPGKL